MAWTLDTLSTENSNLSSISTDWEDFSIIWSSVSSSTESSLESTFLGENKASHSLFNHIQSNWNDLNIYTWDSIGMSGGSTVEPGEGLEYDALYYGSPWLWNFIYQSYGELYTNYWDASSLLVEESLSSAMVEDVKTSFSTTNTQWNEYTDNWNEFTEEDRFNAAIWKYIYFKYFDKIQILFSEWTAKFDEEYISIESEGELDTGSGSIQLDTTYIYNYINRHWNANRIAWESTSFTVTGEGPEVVSYPSLELDQYFNYNGNGPIPIGKWEESTTLWNSLSMEVE